MSIPRLAVSAANSENDFDYVGEERESETAQDNPFTPDLLKDVP